MKEIFRGGGGKEIIFSLPKLKGASGWPVAWSRSWGFGLFIMRLCIGTSSKKTCDQGTLLWLLTVSYKTMCAGRVLSFLRSLLGSIYILLFVSLCGLGHSSPWPKEYGLVGFLWILGVLGTAYHFPVAVFGYLIRCNLKEERCNWLMDWGKKEKLLSSGWARKQERETIWELSRFPIPTPIFFSSSGFQVMNWFHHNSGFGSWVHPIWNCLHYNTQSFASLVS